MSARIKHLTIILLTVVIKKLICTIVCNVEGKSIIVLLCLCKSNLHNKTFELGVPFWNTKPVTLLFIINV